MHVEAGRRWQFRLSTLIGATFLISLLCALWRWGTVYAVIAASLVYSVILVRLFVASHYQRHLRLILTLIGGVLFVGSLWLPVEPDWLMKGWQAAGLAAESLVRLRPRDLVGPRPWQSLDLVAINVGNLAALLLPAFVIWRPRELSKTLTILVMAGPCGAWGFVFFSNDVALSHAFSGYWVWCLALTCLAAARVVPFHVRFRRRRAPRLSNDA